MPCQVVLDASVMRAWSVRGLLVGLAARDPPVLTPRWAPMMLDELAEGIAADLIRARGVDEARRHADGVVAALAAGFPEAEVPDAADALSAARAVRADAIASAEPAAAGRVLGADDLLLELHGDEPGRVLHATVLHGFVLRRPDRSLDDLLDALAVHAPRFVAVVRDRLAALPAGQHGSTAAAGSEAAAVDEREAGWWSIACDPFPCPGHDALAVDLWGTRAACLSGEECSFVGVTQTARHRTLVWPAADDPRLLEIAAEMRDQHRNPRPVPYARRLGPAVSYWEWEATGNLVHGVHEHPPRPTTGGGGAIT